MLLQLTDRGTLKLHLCGRTYAEPGGRWACGLCESAWETDTGCIRAGAMHPVVFIIDGGPKIISVLVDGQLCDGGRERQYGWGRFHPFLRDTNGAGQARIASDMDGEIPLLRLYARPLLSAEAMAKPSVW